MAAAAGPYPYTDKTRRSFSAQVITGFRALYACAKIAIYIKAGCKGGLRGANTLAGDAEKIAAYLKRAAELRAVAERMSSPEAKELLLSISQDYLRLARALEKRKD